MLRVCTGELSHDTSHIRHLFESFHTHPEVSIVGPQEAPDVSFVGPAKLRVRLFRSDPQFLQGEIDLIHPFVEGALRGSRVPGFENQVRHVVDYLNKLGKRRRKAPAARDDLRLAAIDKADLWCPLVSEFYDDYISPHLKHAKIFPLPFSVPERLFHCDLTEARPYDGFWVGNLGASYPLRDHMVGTLRRLYPKGHPEVGP